MASTTGSHGDTGEELMSCAVRLQGPLVEIVVTGEMDIAGRPRLDASAAEALQAVEMATLVIDLSDVTFADSVALTWLVRTAEASRERSADPVVLVRPGPVLALLRMTGLLDRLRVVADASMDGSSR